MAADLGPLVSLYLNGILPMEQAYRGPAYDPNVKATAPKGEYPSTGARYHGDFPGWVYDWTTDTYKVPGQTQADYYKQTGLAQKTPSTLQQMAPGLISILAGIGGKGIDSLINGSDKSKSGGLLSLLGVGGSSSAGGVSQSTLDSIVPSSLLSGNYGGLLGGGEAASDVGSGLLSLAPSAVAPIGTDIGTSMLAGSVPDFGVQSGLSLFA